MILGLEIPNRVVSPWYKSQSEEYGNMLEGEAQVAANEHSLARGEWSTFP